MNAQCIRSDSDSVTNKENIPNVEDGLRECNGLDEEAGNREEYIIIGDSKPGEGGFRDSYLSQNGFLLVEVD